MKKLILRLFCVSIVLSGLSYSFDLNESKGEIYADKNDEVVKNGEELPDEH